MLNINQRTRLNNSIKVTDINSRERRYTGKHKNLELVYFGSILWSEEKVVTFLSETI